MRHIKPYNFCMKHFFFKCVFFEILRGFHTVGKPCVIEWNVKLRVKYLLRMLMIKKNLWNTIWKYIARYHG